MTVISYGEIMGVFASNNSRLKYENNLSFSIAGAEANTLIGLSRLGIESILITAVGNDSVGNTISYQLKGEGINTKFLKVLNNNSTGLMTKERGIGHSINVDYFRKNSAINHLNVSPFFNSIFENANILYLTGITPALSDNTYKTTINLINEAKKRGLTIIFDPNYRKKLWSENSLKNFYNQIKEHIDVLLAGKKEAEILFEDISIENLNTHINKSNLKLLVIKDGDKGATFINQHKHIVEKAYPVTEIDSVGAGDAFASGLIYGLEKYGYENISDYSKYALAMGAIATTSYGDFHGLPTLTELENFITNELSDVER
ncbi:sugar kinase [Staphylococcus haemolyticus]|uniref:sugar kinase n=1 Tax=Staphylococcus haemolyticus TaxID=1283 RepID=UPI001F0B3D07|nr:sugar kinase [Staphylococcus haemolyticus]MCH4491419.1 sugar kinase [Staphylococcus haemolyticus]MDU0435442.1 sugar kinase [Staphylococcus haemolyticus]